MKIKMKKMPYFKKYCSSLLDRFRYCSSLSRTIPFILILILLANSILFAYPKTASAQTTNFAPPTPPVADSGYDYSKDSNGVEKAMQSAGTPWYIVSGIEWEIKSSGFYPVGPVNTPEEAAMIQQQRLDYLRGKILDNTGSIGSSTRLAAYKAINNYVKANPVTDESGVIQLSTSDSQANLKNLNLAVATYYELWTQFYYDAKDFTTKCTWSPYDINLLYSLIWPDLKANRPLKDFTSEELNRLASILEDPNMTTAIGQVNQNKDLKEILHQLWAKGNDVALVYAAVDTPFGLYKLVKGGWGVIGLLRSGKLVEGFGTVAQDLKAGFSLKGALATEDVALNTARMRVEMKAIGASDEGFIGRFFGIGNSGGLREIPASQIPGVIQQGADALDILQESNIGKYMSKGTYIKIFDNTYFINLQEALKMSPKKRFLFFPNTKVDFWGCYSYSDGKIYILETAIQKGELKSVYVHEALHYLYAQKGGAYLIPKGWKYDPFQEGMVEFLASKITGGTYGSYSKEVKVFTAIDSALERYRTAHGISGLDNYSLEAWQYRDWKGHEGELAKFINMHNDSEKGNMMGYFDWVRTEMVQGHYQDVIDYTNSLWK
jgi:hypothetical protein